MPDLNFTINDFSPEVLAAAQEQIEAALDAVGIQATGYAMDVIEAGVPRHADSWYVPQGAAGLRGSISHQVEAEEKTVYVGSSSSHAIFNEIGTGIYVEDGSGRKSPWAYQDENGNWHRTRGITPLHFLKKSMADHIDEYKQIIEHVLKDE